MSVAVAPHLGGYTPGGDPATFFPELWRWLVTDYGVRSLIDVGCGEGHAVREFARAGAFAIGVDGIEQPDETIYVHDYTLGPLTVRPFDLCWSCEFVEHLDERYVPNFLATFACAELVLITHAEPGQGGYHHVNCQPAAYWVGAFAAIGYQLNQQLTAVTRELAAINRSPWNHYLRSGLAFERRGK